MKTCRRLDIAIGQGQTILRPVQVEKMPRTKPGQHPGPLTKDIKALQIDDPQIDPAPQSHECSAALQMNEAPPFR